MRQFFAGVWEILEVVLIALITVFVVRTFIVQPFLVSGASMEPTFNDGNYLLIDEATYYFREPQRGEITVFRYPADRRSFFIKRIVALPEERIVIEGGQVKIGSAQDRDNLQLLEEPYLKEGVLTSGSIDIILEDDEYFVLGDNRPNSFDSRNWGTLEEDNIVGLVRIQIFPFGDFGTVSTPQYTY
ncbi:MAG: signal peptidase I [Candidatus Harrisonbacteria bacterium]|nr:signal peptidase I [Candidatus Harrisonbacteria bacterium]